MKLASRVIDAVVPGHRLVSVIPNSVQVLDTLSPGGSRLRLVVKRMTDEPDPERATADFHGLRIARKGGIPAPEPVLLDATGELLGVPGIVTTYVEGTQNANPSDPKVWAKDIAELLLRIHDIRLDDDDRRNIYDGNELALYFLSGEYPERMAGHPLSETIYGTIRELRGSQVADRPVFLHMDFWPGNILWADGRVSAVVDWDASGRRLLQDGRVPARHQGGGSAVPGVLRGGVGACSESRLLGARLRRTSTARPGGVDT
ncbi:MAG: aminoglycoside phosphotransferase family protein [Dehalococcoidia bacterium]|nr:aminoglycoside phosphotransferase family protein [Dehalococcoidia bacterium]